MEKPWLIVIDQLTDLSMQSQRRTIEQCRTHEQFKRRIWQNLKQRILLAVTSFIHIIQNFRRLKINVC